MDRLPIAHQSILSRILLLVEYCLYSTWDIDAYRSKLLFQFYSPDGEMY